MNLSETDRMSSKVLRPQAGAQSKLELVHNLIKELCSNSTELRKHCLIDKAAELSLHTDSNSHLKVATAGLKSNMVQQLCKTNTLNMTTFHFPTDDPILEPR